MLIDGAFVPLPVPGVVAVDAAGEAVLVDEAHDLLHLLNGSGALLWECFDGDASIAEVCFDIADELDVPFERVLTDAVEVVGELVSAGLLGDGRGGRGPEVGSDGRATDLGLPPRPRLLDEPPSG